MTTVSPDIAPTAELERELRFLNGMEREDAVQEAWVALLEGESAMDAVSRYRHRERRRRTREVTIGSFH